MSQAAFDASIPVLTEVFQPEPVTAAAPTAAAPAVLASAAPDLAPSAAPLATQQATSAAAPAGPPAATPAAVTVHGEAAEPPATGSAHAEAAALASLDGDGWAMLEQRLTERVVHSLQSRVDFVLEQRIRDCMADVLNHAVRELTDELRVGLQGTIEQIVARAVAQELVHLQAQKHG